MVLSFKKVTQEAPTEAIVFADGFAEFDALAHDIDHAVGAGMWAEVRREDAAAVLTDGANGAKFAIIALSSDLPEMVDKASELIRISVENKMRVLLIVGELSPRTVHKLLREGVTEFAPYPDSDGALGDAVGRLRLAASEGEHVVTGLGAARARRGKVVTVYGTAGGVGASTLAVNLAWELSSLCHKRGMKVALLDFNFQYGSVATYLDVPRREAVYELVSEAASLDQTGLAQALSTFEDKLQVLTAPRDSLPLDIVSPADVSAIITLAREAFDFVVIDMPQSLMNWSEQVYSASDIFYAVMEVDMRSAQNMFRFLRTLKSEDIELDKIEYVLNRAPGMTDLSGKARVRRVAESLSLNFTTMLPDGGKQVINACDQGTPLGMSAKSNPLRREIAKLAKSVIEAEVVAAQG